MTGIDTGIKELFANLDTLPAKVEVSLTRKGLKEISNQLSLEAKANAPVRKNDNIYMKVGKTHTKKKRNGKYGTYQQNHQGAFTTVAFFAKGQLRDSITAVVRKTKGAITASVGTAVYYARFVEYGFMHHSTKGKKTHVPPQPFLTPVYESSYNRVMDYMVKFLQSEVPKQMTKFTKKWLKS